MRQLTPTFVAAALLLNSCGDDSDSSADKAPVALQGEVEDHGKAEIEAGKLELELDDFYFEPTYIKGKPGKEVTLELFNEGDELHSFTSAALGVDKDIAPEQRTSVTMTLPDTGSAEFQCRFHHGRGMKGAFYVENE